MEKKISFIDYKSSDFYFLYLKQQSKRGATAHKWQEHSFYEIQYIAEGESEYMLENRRYELKKGDVLLIKPACPHYKSRVIKTPSTVYCLGFLPTAIENNGLAERIFERGELVSLGENSPIADMLDLTRKKLQASKTNAASFIKLIAEAIVLLLCDLDIVEEREKETKNKAVQKMLAYIKENLTAIKRVEDVANALFFSDSYTRNLFKKEMGIGIMEYVRNKRVLLAYRRIRHGRRPSEVYAECGFSNYTTFYRAYTSYFGHSPKMQDSL